MRGTIEGGANLDDDRRRISKDVGGGETEQPYPGIQQPVLPPVVVGQAVAMSSSVVLDAELVIVVVEIGTADESSPAVMNGDLRPGPWQTSEDEDHPQTGLHRRFGIRLCER